MKKLFVILLCLICSLANSQGLKLNELKVIRHIPSGMSSLSAIHQMKIDKAGNKYICGKTGPGWLNVKTGYEHHISPGSGLFICKYDSLDNLIWTAPFFNPNYSGSFFTNLEIDNSQCVVASINAAGTQIDINPDLNRDSILTGTNFLIKLDASGKFVFGGKFETIKPYSVSFDNANNIYLSGPLTASLDVNMANSINTILTYTPNVASVFIVKYDSVGHLLFKDQISGGPGQVTITKLRLTEQNQLLLIGRDANPGLDFDFGPGIANTNTYNLFIAKYDSLFNLLSVNTLTTNNFSSVSPNYYLECDKNSFYIAGRLHGLVDFNFGPGIDTLPTNTTFTANGYIVRYDDNLNVKSLKPLRSILSYTNSFRSICSDTKTKNFYVSHYLGQGPQSIDYSPTPTPSIVNTTVSLAAYSAASYDSLGNLINFGLVAQPIMGNSGVGSAAAAAGKGKFHLSGFTIDSCDVDMTSSTYKLKRRTGNGFFIATYSSSLSINFGNINSNITNTNSTGGSIELEGNKIARTGNEFILAGKYSDFINYHPDPLTTHTISNFNNIPSWTNFGIFFAKYDNNLNPLFVRQLECNGLGTHTITGLRIDNLGNILISGNVFNNSSIDFDPSASIVNGSGNTYAFIAKYSPSGNYIWSKQFQNSTIVDFAIDKNNDVLVIGGFSGPTMFNTTNVYSGANGDAFLLKLNPGGVFQWVETTNCSGTDAFWKISIDGSNNIIIIGYHHLSAFGFINPISFNASSHQGFVIKLKPDKTPVFWHTFQGSFAHDYFHDIAIDNLNNYFLIGSCQSNPIDFDFSNNIFSGSSGGFIAKYDSSFNFKYVKTFPGFFSDKIKLSPGEKHIYAYGSKFPPTTSTDCDPGPGVKPIVFGSAIAKYDSLGNYLFAESINKNNLSVSYNRLNDLEFGTGGSVVIFGDFRSSTGLLPLCNFSLDTLVKHNVPANIKHDIYLTSYCSTPMPSLASGNINICSGSSTTLTASTSSTKWYNTPIGGNVIGTQVISTPVLTANATYYMQDSNSCGKVTEYP